MPFCVQCAHAIPDGARFCPACATPVAVPTSGPAAELRVTQTPTVVAPPASPSARPASSGFSSGIHGRFEPGTRLGTRYRIVALLGRGGMGEVYRADDLELGQSVALKFLPASVATNETELARFRSEVRIARLIAHPNVCRVYDIGEADGHVFLSMEYIDGEDLAAVLRRMGRPTGDKATEIARQICLGLGAAHEAGMLHRDLKPANIMVDGRGRARITDFGLAGLAADFAGRGEFAGTPAYMAPEQLDGGQVSVRSDVYSLGLLLYELFTGKRVFQATSVAELKRLQDSGSVTSPSEFARDIDPAVERLIMHCLERDPDARPSSAYAVLGALPGADPLAAALAAGETPSPELVANAGGRGATRGRTVALCIALAVFGVAAWATILGPEFKPLIQPTGVLAVRAADLLARSGSFTTLPKYSEEGFAQNAEHLRHLRVAGGERREGTSPIYFWRRWSPRLIESPNVHNEIIAVNDPPFLAPGQAAVLLDPAGRLIGLRALPADSIPAAGGPAWSLLWSAAGLDSATFTPAPLARPVPAMCDSAAAWAGTLPWAGGEPVTVQMGASRGRLTHFTIVHDWGASTAAIDSLKSDPYANSDWVSFLLFTLIPLVASIVFAVRNLRARRGDWRGATRIAVFVIAMNLLEGLSTTRITEVGLLGALADLISGRAYGHALMHGFEMWFAYVAIEPYVRRLWPHMLVGWSRLGSGRMRDPLVGRELLIGCGCGAVLVALRTIAPFASARFGLTRVPTLIEPVMLTSVTDLATTICNLAYSGSVCVLAALGMLVSVVVMRLLLRRTGLAVVIALIASTAAFAAAAAGDVGWPVAIIQSLATTTTLLVFMRFGVLAGTTAMFVTIVLSSAVPSLDLSAWYADRALAPILVLAAIVGFGAFAALAGKSIWGDPLKEPAR